MVQSTSDNITQQYQMQLKNDHWAVIKKKVLMIFLTQCQLNPKHYKLQKDGFHTVVQVHLYYNGHCVLGNGTQQLYGFLFYYVSPSTLTFA